MKCPYCGNDSIKVIDKRDVDEGKSTRRRRECLSCKKRFTTYEHVEPLNVLVVKKDGLRQYYNRDKILNGILTACQKRKIEFSVIQRALKEIEEQIQDFGKEEVQSSQIGDIVAKKLFEIDDVAYVRFVSVYKRFNTLEEFKKELQEIEKTRKNKQQ